MLKTSVVKLEHAVINFSALGKLVNLRTRLNYTCTLVSQHSWNFIVRRVKFNGFLHPNIYPERNCFYLVRQFEAELAKIGHFQILKSIFEARYDSIFLKPKFLFEYHVRKIIFIKIIYFSTIFVKMLIIYY